MTSIFNFIKNKLNIQLDNLILMLLYTLIYIMKINCNLTDLENPKNEVAIHHLNVATEHHLDLIINKIIINSITLMIYSCSKPF